MIAKDVIIDFEKKLLSYHPKGSKRIYTLNELYSYLQDVFDEPMNMKYGIPISAESKNQYTLINGWSIDKKCLPYLSDGILSVVQKITLPKRSLLLNKTSKTHAF